MNIKAPRTHLNTLLTVDGYETDHYRQYPEAAELTSYLTFRKGMEMMSISEKKKYPGWVDNDHDDDRIVFTGIRYIIETYIDKPITIEDIAEAKDYYSTFKAGGTAYPFPEKLLLKVVNDYNGFMPLRIESLPEGSVVYPNIPVVQISAIGEFAPLVTWFEALIVQTWYPSVVATLSRRVKDMIEAAFKKSADEEAKWKIPSRLHDFGFRGTTCPEQGIIGGMAHLLNFEGTDTVLAAHYATRYMNNGNQVGSSIPAQAHCVVTPWPTEKEAFENMIELNGDGVYAMVMDSYDYSNAINKIIPSLKEKITKKGGFVVLRPDSGEPVDMVLLGLQAAATHFGYDLNKKGYKVLRGIGIIQGDGMSPRMIKDVLEKVIDAGFSAENVAFGMGGGLLQKDLHRDILSAALKTNHIRYLDGSERMVMKKPTGDSNKISLPGKLAVTLSLSGSRQVTPEDTIIPGDNELEVVYDAGKTIYLTMDTFDQIRDRVNIEWKMTPKKGEVLTNQMKRLRDKIAKGL